MGVPLPADLQTLHHRLTTARDLPGRAASAADHGRPSGLPELDRLLAGGLPRGGLVELVGRPSSGRFSTVLAALAAASGETTALVDLGGNLDPAAAAAAGASLERLLWVRPRNLRQALAGAEIVLAAGFALVVVDLGTPPVPGGRGPESAWLRLARTAAQRRSTLLVSSPYRVSGTAATAVVAAERRQGLWQGAGRAPRLLRGLSNRLVVHKIRGRRAGANAALEFAGGAGGTGARR